MPATFSGRCLRRLLLLLCISLSGGSLADPAMTTQDSSQAQVNFVTKTQVGRESSGPNVAIQELKTAGKENSNSVSGHEIVLIGTSLEKKISLPSPTKVDLTCKLDNSSHLENPQVTWKKGSETISHTSKTPNSWTIQVTVSDRSQLGSYACILKAEKEISAMFHLQVPKLEGREKPVITYERDKAVMVCKTEYNPKTWSWYMANGTELVPIDKILRADKLQIKTPSPNVNHLEILNLTKEDSGVYWCEATFELGSSQIKFELKVLSIEVPLKPFIAIVAEVAILFTTIVLCEVCSKRKGKGSKKEFDQIEQLKSEVTTKKKKK